MRNARKNRSVPRRIPALLLSRLRRKPLLYAAVRWTGVALCSFFTASAPFFDRPVPAALALICVLPFGPDAICCFLGAAFGYWKFWPMAYALEPMAAGLLLLAGSCLFQSYLPEKGWARPLFFTGLYLPVAFVFLLDRHTRPTDVTFFALRLALLALLTFRMQSFPDTRARLTALLACAGLGRLELFSLLPLSVPLLTAAAILFTQSADGLLLSSACALALDVTLLPDLPLTVIFLLAAALCRRGRLQQRVLRGGVYLTLCTGAHLLLGTSEGALVIGVGLGAVLACLIPDFFFSQDPVSVQPPATLTASLSSAADLMLRICRLLDQTAITAMEPQSAAVFDRAAETLCRSCAKWDTCWESGAERTYLALSRAAVPILQHGSAKRDDLPPFFLEQCCHVDSFLTAVNEELDSQLSRRQFHIRMQETRAAVADHYRSLSRFLTMLSEQPQEDAVPDRFAPELGSCGRKAGSVSGDRVCTFRRGEWYYVLLCDGMGTGEEAGRESALAAELLQDFIGLGFDVQDSLQLLNELYVLREDYSFSTADLLQLSLVTGDGFLHKWGSAPSYLLRNGSLKKIGTAAPPPGLGVGESHRAECVRLSLEAGELLVLLSDGVEPMQAEAVLSHSQSASPRQIAGELVAGSSREDDSTAAVVALRPVSLREHHTTRRTRILSKSGVLSHI